MQNQYLQMIATLIGILALMLLMVYLMKKLKLNKFANNKYIKIINAVSVGPKEKVILMEVNNAILLIGATPNHIETLYVFDELKPNADISMNKSRYADEAAKLSDG